MKTKKVLLKLESKKQFYDRIAGYMKQLDKGVRKQFTENEVLSVRSLAELQKILTQKRMEILATIRDRKPQSIYELAKMVKRDQGNVQTDVTFLKNLGFIEIEKEKKGRMKAIPKVDYDILDFRIPLVAGVCLK